MALSAGTRLGPYEITAPIGAGGMGEVYRARDTRLERTVAIKVLSAHVAASPDFRQRFEREAKTISGLNHPNICTLHDVGQQETAEGPIDFLVMEHLEGESLAERLKKGPVPLDQAMRHAVEIADALDKAHRNGVIHRDLKPANIMLTKSGAKLLDFGLAKATAQGGGGALSALATAEKPLTEAGTVLGTFQYMAPEQLEGREADARTDVFAFGAVLYEMLTGRRAFEGKSQASLISSIMGSEPAPLSAVQPMTPPALERVVRNCLAKDPDDRWQSAHDVAAELRWIAEGGSQAGVPAPVVARRRSRERWAWGLAGLLGLVAAVALGALVARRDTPHASTRFVISLPEKTTGMNWPRLSPDGRTLAFLATDAGGKEQIWVRPLGAFDAYALAGTEGAGRPFWSPDSKNLGFFTGTQLKKIAATGGPTQLICECAGSDGSWGNGDVILFDAAGTDPVRRVSASGGLATEAAAFDKARGEIGIGWPSFLPDGVHFFIIGIRPKNEAALLLGSLESKQVKILLERIDSLAQYSPSGHVLYVSQGTLLAQPFSLRKLGFTGDPVPVGEKVASQEQRADFSVSDSGALAYMLGAGNALSRLVLVDRTGKELQSLGEAAAYRDVAFSPDGTRLAYGLADSQSGKEDIWVRDLKRDVASRLTFDVANDLWPTWSRDGSRIAFASDRKGSYDLFRKLSSGAGEDEWVLQVEGSHRAPDEFTSDGRLLFQEQDNAGTWDLRVVPLSGERKPATLLATPFNEQSARLSPDERYLAYQSTESGRSEVYVQPFPLTGAKWQISTSGGGTPQWRADGHELFFRDLEGYVNAVGVTLGASFDAGIPKRLFPAKVQTAGIRRWRWTVSADGQRFLINAAVDNGAPAAFKIVLDWTADLEKK